MEVDVAIGLTAKWWRARRPSSLVLLVVAATASTLGGLSDRRRGWGAMRDDRKSGETSKRDEADDSARGLGQFLGALLGAVVSSQKSKQPEPSARSQLNQARAAAKTDYTQDLRRWHRSARTDEVAQQMACTHYQTIDTRLGFVVTGLAALTGSSLFASLLTAEDQAILLVAGGLSVLTTALSLIHTQEKYGEKAVGHSKMSARYGRLEKALSTALTAQRQGKAVSDKRMDAIADEIEVLRNDKTPVSDAIWQRAQARVDAGQD